MWDANVNLNDKTQQQQKKKTYRGMLNKIWRTCRRTRATSNSKNNANNDAKNCKSDGKVSIPVLNRATTK